MPGSPPPPPPCTSAWTWVAPTRSGPTPPAGGRGSVAPWSTRQASPLVTEPRPKPEAPPSHPARAGPEPPPVQPRRSARTASPQPESPMEQPRPTRAPPLLPAAAGCHPVAGAAFLGQAYMEQSSGPLSRSGASSPHPPAPTSCRPNPVVWWRRSPRVEPTRQGSPARCPRQAPSRGQVTPAAVGRLEPSLWRASL